MPTITFEVNGQSYEVAAGTRYHDFCQEHDAPQDFGCTVGSCGTCRLALTAGADHVNPRSEDEAETLEMCTDEEGARLGCQLVVNGDITVRAIE